MDNLKFENNIATASAAGIVFSNKANVTLTNCVFTNVSLDFVALINRLKINERVELCAIRSCH